MLIPLSWLFWPDPNSMLSTLHQKVKYPLGGRVEEIVGNQLVARQGLVAAISHRHEASSSAIAERDL